MKLNKLIGVAIVKENGFCIDWSYIYYPWQYNAEVENEIKKFNPFKPLNRRISSIQSNITNQKEYFLG